MAKSSRACKAGVAIRPRDTARGWAGLLCSRCALALAILWIALGGTDAFAELQKALVAPYPAPEFALNETWINDDPLTMSLLRGKVVLVDFWAYSCVNCVRTLPHLEKWYEEYGDKGLVIIGVHVPEFDFEGKEDNVRRAVEKYGIKYPVVLDNDMTTWHNFNNQYWPAHYLIDRSGKVVYTHYGEGEYDVTENNIRTLLGIDGVAARDTAAPPYSAGQTPETYLGFDRLKFFSDAGKVQPDIVATYKFPDNLQEHYWALQGPWKIMGQRIVAAGKDSAIRLHFNARKVFMVMGNRVDRPLHVSLTLDGKPAGDITVDHSALYPLIDRKTFGEGVLEIHVEPGLSAYSFTFGG